MTDYKTLPLTRGLFAVIDAEDYEKASQFRWSAALVKTKSGNRYYAHRTVWTDWKRKLQTKILLHRFILDAPKGIWVDHANRDTLDCRKGNLRFATKQQNIVNRVLPSGASYRGVMRTESGKYLACIGFNYKRIRLGNFRSPIDAAKAYDSKALELFGEFAVLNFPQSK
jgi:hypothetical protein